MNSYSRLNFKMEGSLMKSFAGVVLVLCYSISPSSSAVIPTDLNGQNKTFGYLPFSGRFRDSIEPEFQNEFLTSLVFPPYVKNFLSLVNQKQGSDFEDLLKLMLIGVSNDNCKGHVLEWIWRVKDRKELLTEKGKWVLQMVDSWGKPPEGILSGHVNAYGDFGECVEIEASDITVMNPMYKNISRSFEGRYCTVYLADYGTSMSGTPYPINPSKEGGMARLANGKELEIKKAVSVEELIRQLGILEGIQIIPSAGVCMPTSCQRNDVQQILVNIFNIAYNVNVSRWGESYPKKLAWPHTLACYEEKKPDLDAADYSVMTLIGGIALLCLIAGVTDYWLNHGVEKPPKRGLAYNYFMAFSLYTNIRKWMSTRKSADDLGCLHGIRFFSTSWVVLAHTYYVVTFLPQWNMIDVKNVYEDWSVLTIINSTFSVDTFFVMSGMLVTYNILKVLDKTKGKLNIIMLYIHRYLRLTPTYAILVGIMATIIPYLGNGPYWAVMTRWGNICENNWWTNLLYVNNFVNTSWLCQGEAWYLANDMQFYIVSPFIIYPLWKWEMIGAILLAVYTVLSCAAPMLLVHFYDTTPTTIPTRDIGKWFTHIYIRPYARIQTYLVGMWLAWLLHKTKGKKVKLSPIIVATGWILSTVIALTVLYSIQDWFDPANEIPKVAGLAYAGLSRFGWGLSVAWIMFACIKGYGGLINSFLSWNVFMPLGRLCYCVYLVSLHLQMILHVRFTQPLRYDRYTQVNYFFAHMLMSFIVGFFCTLLFESPFMILQKLIFEGAGPSRPQQPQAKRPSKRYGIFYNNTDSIMNGGAWNDSKSDIEKANKD